MATVSNRIRGSAWDESDLEGRVPRRAVAVEQRGLPYGVLREFDCLAVLETICTSARGVSDESLHHRNPDPGWRIRRRVVSGKEPDAWNSRRFGKSKDFGASWIKRAGIWCHRLSCFGIEFLNHCTGMKKVSATNHGCTSMIRVMCTLCNAVICLIRQRQRRRLFTQCKHAEKHR
jgi:hypothetical protein